MNVGGSGRTYRFEYNQQGKLKRDINYYTSTATVINQGRPMVVTVPGSRDYYYTANGFVDSVGFGHWANNVWVSDSFGIKYHYSFDGKLTSKISCFKDSVTRVETNSYDSTGNLILNKVIRIDIYTGDTTINSSEYDSLNRITLRKTYNSNNPQSLTQYDYRYDSAGNIHCAMTSISYGDTSQSWNYSFKFDSIDKISNEIFCIINDTLNLSFNFDGTGKILNMGRYARFHYDSEGNLDTLAILHTVYSGYLGAKGTLFDSYGNTISLVELGGGISNLYYSKKITGVTTSNGQSRTFTLSQNYPNPFNPTTIISFYLPSRSVISLKIFDILGREIATIVNSETLSAGSYSRQWNAAGVSSGLYFYRLQADAFTETKKLLLLR